MLKESKNVVLKMFFSALPIVVFAFLTFWISSFAMAGTCTVDATVTNQYIHCIGASSAWSGVGSLGQELFADDNVNGHIGITSLRTRIDPTAVNGNTGAWNSELNNITAAYAANPNVLFWSTEWSPPAEYKTNDNVNGYYVDAQGNTCYGGFSGAGSGSANSADTGYAAYLTQYVQYVKSYTGVNLYSISPQNESNFSPDYEGCTWSAGQFDVFVPVLYNDFQSAGISTKIMIPEPDNEYGMNLASTTMDDPNAAPMVGILCTHLYGSFYDTLPEFGFTHVTNQEWWETEISGCDNNDMSGALCVGGWAHQSLVEGQMNAFHYWWLDDLIVNNALDMKAFALGNFSKFIRPGYYRMGATEVPSTGLQVSAYKDTNNLTPGTIVIVAINNNSSAVSQPFSLNGLNVTSVTPWVTDANNTLVAQAAVAVSGNSFTYNLTGPSITTFVGTNLSGGTPVPTATLTPCTPTSITPYYQVNGGSWVEANSVTVVSGSTVNLGPQPLTGGTWSWTGPNGFTSTSREIDGIPLSTGTNTFAATYTNACGSQSTEAFTVTVLAPTPTVTNTMTTTLTATVSPTLTQTSTKTYTVTITLTLTGTDTPLPTVTRTNTPTWTLTSSPTFTRINTPSFTVTLTFTNTITPTPSVSPTVTLTHTQVNTETNTPQNTATNTPINTETETLVNTITLTNTPLPTQTNTPKNTAVNTVTPSATPTVGASLVAGITVSPGSAIVGQNITVIMQVVNTGTNTADNVQPSVLNQTGGGTATIVSGPSSASATIPSNSVASFTWVYTVTSVAGNITFSGTAIGTDAINGTSVSSSTVSSSSLICVTATATIANSITTTITPSITATITATATNYPAPVLTPTPWQLTGPRIYPNPTKGKFNYVFNLSEDADIEISIYTVAFRLVAKVSQTESAGPHIMEIDTAQSMNLASGTYYIVYNEKGQTTKTQRVDKLIVLK